MAPKFHTNVKWNIPHGWRCAAPACGERGASRLDDADRHPRPARSFAAGPRGHDVHRVAEAYVCALDLNKEDVIKWEFRPTYGCRAGDRADPWATLDGQNIALDAKSGEQLWRTVGADIARGEGMAGKNIAIGKNFIGGNEGGERGARGANSAGSLSHG